MQLLTAEVNIKLNIVFIFQILQRLKSNVTSRLRPIIMKIVVLYVLFFQEELILEKEQHFGSENVILMVRM